MTCTHHWIPGNHPQKTGYRMDLELYRRWLIRDLERPDLADPERYPWLKPLQRRLLTTTEGRLAFIAWLCEVFEYDDPVKLIQVFGREYLKRQPMGGCLVNTITLTALLAEATPDDEYPERHLQRVPSGTLEDPGYRRTVMEEVRAGRPLEELYAITRESFSGSAQARSLLAWYEGSPSQAVLDIYGQDYDFEVFRFKNLPNTFCRTVENRRILLRSIESELGIQVDEDWYRVTSRDVYGKSKAQTLLGNHYRGSVFSMLKELRPDRDWRPERFAMPPHGYWGDDDACREALERFQRERGLTRRELYRTSNKELIDAGLYGITARFGSMRGAAKHLDGADLKEWEWNDVPNRYWDDSNHVRARILSVLDTLGDPVTPQSLYGLSQKTLRRHGCSGLLQVRGDIPMAALIMEAFPDLDLDSEEFGRFGKFQSAVGKMLSKILNDVPLVEYKGHGLRYRGTGRPISVDLYFPKSDLHVECQGEVHFLSSPAFGGVRGLEDTVRRDGERLEQFVRNGKLIGYVHYGWDGTEADLIRQFERQGIYIKEGRVVISPRIEALSFEAWKRLLIEAGFLHESC